MFCVLYVAIQQDRLILAEASSCGRAVRLWPCFRSILGHPDLQCNLVVKHQGESYKEIKK